MVYLNLKFRRGEALEGVLGSTAFAEATSSVIPIQSPLAGRPRQRPPICRAQRNLRLLCTRRVV